MCSVGSGFQYLHYIIVILSLCSPRVWRGSIPLKQIGAALLSDEEARYMPLVHHIHPVSSVIKDRPPVEALWPTLGATTPSSGCMDKNVPTKHNNA